MIQYALKCKNGHTFDSWFQSADAYDRLAKAGLVECAVCGAGGVEKAIMTPRVRQTKSQAADLRAPATPAEQAIAHLRKQVEDNSDYVGADFASEARAMHDGDIPERSIYGEARLDEAKKLVDDGVPVLPLPFSPNRKAN